METVKDSSNGAIYGADCSNILLKDILSVRKYWCEISQQQWTGMFWSLLFVNFSLWNEISPKEHSESIYIPQMTSQFNSTLVKLNDYRIWHFSCIMYFLNCH